VKVRNQAIGTDMTNMKFIMGAKSTKTGQSPVSTAAKAPVATVARWFPRYPMKYGKNSLFITVMLKSKNEIKKDKGVWFIRLLGCF
jgi:hypothetical protein